MHKSGNVGRRSRRAERADEKRWNRIFHQNHGTEEAEYYATAVRGESSTLAAVIDAVIGRGRCGRVRPCRGAQ